MRYIINSPADKKPGEVPYTWPNGWSVILVDDAGPMVFTDDPDTAKGETGRLMAIFNRFGNSKFDEYVPRNAYLRHQIGEYEGPDKAKVDFLLKEFGYTVPDNGNIRNIMKESR